jgi:hypothetical protein
MIIKIQKKGLQNLLGLAVASLLLTGRVHAYETDTHFTMTYVMCVAVGMDEADALIVAQYDQGMDDSPGTVANKGLSAHETEEKLWHAIPEKSSAVAVLARKKELWDIALQESDKTKRLQRLGVFFHYQQDTWAHRKHPNSDANNFQTYEVPFGHAADNHQPDRPPFDGVCALRCLEDGIGYVTQYLQHIGRGPRALLRGYTPASGTVDGGGSNGRRGKYIRQLQSDPSTSAHKFTTDLIREQINAYDFSMDDLLFPGRDTSDEANYGRVRNNLQAVCQRNGISINIPASRVQITTLTTAQLLVPPTLSIPATNDNVATTGTGIIRGTIRFGTDIATSDGVAQQIFQSLKVNTEVRTGMSASNGIFVAAPTMTKVGNATLKELKKNNDQWEISYEVGNLPTDVPIGISVFKQGSFIGKPNGWEGKITIQPSFTTRRRPTEKKRETKPPTQNSAKSEKGNLDQPSSVATITLLAVNTMAPSSENGITQNIDANQLARTVIVLARKDPKERGIVSGIDFILVPIGVIK